MDYFPGEAKNDCVYSTVKRDNGSGPLRLGTILAPNPDIYSLLIAANFRTDIVDRHRWDAKMADDAIAQIVDKYAQANAKFMPDEIRPATKIPNPTLNEPTEETTAAADEPADSEPFALTNQDIHIKAKGNYLSQVLLCWSLQMALCFLLAYEMLRP